MIPKGQSIDQLINEYGGYIRMLDYKLFNPDKNSLNFNPFKKMPKSYEKSCPEIKQFIGTLLKLCNSRKTIKDYHKFHDVEFPLEEIIRNAIFHGNNADPILQMSLKIIELNNAYIIRIRDSGVGYNVQEKQSSMVNNRPYFKHYGEGTRATAFTPVKITYENKGTTWNIIMEK